MEEFVQFLKGKFRTRSTFLFYPWIVYDKSIVDVIESHENESFGGSFLSTSLFLDELSAVENLNVVT